MYKVIITYFGITVTITKNTLGHALDTAGEFLLWASQDERQKQPCYIAVYHKDVLVTIPE